MNKETGILLGVAALGAGALLLSRDASAEGTSTGNGGGASTGNGGGTSTGNGGSSIGDVTGSDAEVGTAPTPARSPESAPRGYALGGRWTREPEYPFEGVVVNNLGFQIVLTQFLDLLPTRPAFALAPPAQPLRPSDVRAFQRGCNSILREYRRFLRLGFRTTPSSNPNDWNRPTYSADSFAQRRSWGRMMLTPYEEAITALAYRQPELFLGAGCSPPELDNGAPVYGSTDDSRTNAIFSSSRMSTVEYNQSDAEIEAGGVMAARRAASSTRDRQGLPMPSDSIGELLEDGVWGPCTERAQFNLYNLLGNAGLFSIAEQISGLDPETGSPSGARVDSAAAATELANQEAMSRFQASVMMLQVPEALDLPLGIYNSNRQG
jgi:hypothetical protein